MPHIRKTYNYYVERNLPVPRGVKPKTTGYERKTWSWYTARNMEPPAHLKPPKAIREGATNVFSIVGNQSQVVMPTISQPSPLVSVPETDAEVLARINTRFDVLESLVQDVVDGDIRSLIISGPPGFSKSYTVEHVMGQGDVKYEIVKGHSRATGLFKMLWRHRKPGSIIVFDDCDSVFGDEVALNLLKTALDTTEERVISWLAEGAWLEAEGIPNQFEFEGSVIFITNLDFDRTIAGGSKIGKHLEALISRSHYVDLGIKSARDCVVRIKEVVATTEMLSHLGKSQKESVIKFIEDNMSNLREVSLRTALKVATLVASGKPNWEAVAQITCCKHL